MANNRRANNLRTWLLQQPKDAFPGPGTRTYLDFFKAAEAYFNHTVHPSVEKLAMTIDGGYLTGHGVSHINTIISRATELVGLPCKLSPYEVYILLIAIHLHDVGNVYGRPQHEQRLAEVVNHLGPLLGSDAIEIKLIQKIAQAHGGKDEYGRTIDRIADLLPVEHILGSEVRLQLLAAILRFSDELSDDKERADHLAISLDLLPPEAKLYHQFAHRLHSVRIEHDTKSVELRFNLDKDVACQTFLKDNTPRYLLDEIYSRTMKMHRERIYCSRYMRTHADIEYINVHIDVYRQPDNISASTSIKYSLRETGYPPGNDGIASIVSNLEFDGTRLKAYLEKSQEVSHNAV